MSTSETFRRPHIKTLTLLASVLLAACVSCARPAETEAPDARPNILWITWEDASPVLGAYGDAHAVTPNLDRVARQGVRYSKAFSTASVCSPARSSLITGMYATSLGTQHLRSTVPIPPRVRCFPAYLRDAGYYTTNNVKEDYNFETPRECWDESSRQAHWRNRKPGQPFFSVFNITTTHQSQIRLPDEKFAERTAALTARERHDPATILLPPYYPDTPVVRRDVAKFYDLVTAMDKEVGDLLDQLDDDGLSRDTIVFFYSDHGTGLPRHKRWLYDSGIQVPLIIRFPETFGHVAPAEAGRTIDRLVSFVDFAPTVLSLVGLEIPGHMEGRAFLGERAGESRDHVFAVLDRVDEVYDMSRSVRDARYKYIRNYFPHRPVMARSQFSEVTPTRQELRRLAGEGALSGPPAMMVRPTKPAEELYDTEKDPWEIHNLAASPAHEELLQRLRQAHRQWMLDTRDTGLLPEAELYLRNGGRPPYDVVREDDYPLKRVVEAADLVGRGASVLPQLTERLADPDRAVRYWAATGLAALGPSAEPATDALIRALKDPAPDVRLTAAEALCHMDCPEQALAVLVAGLDHDEVFVRLHAAMALAAVGEAAQPVVPDLTRIMERKDRVQADSYVRWALGHLLDVSFF